MPVGFSSPARNLFLLASTAGGTLANFFKTLDQSSGTDVNFEPTEIRSVASDETYTLAGEADNSSGDRFGWFENVDYTGSENWSNKIQSSTAGTETTLRTLEIDGSGNYLVAGKTGTHPWIAKYSSTGVLSWDSTTFSGDVEYTGIAVDSNNVYYACGSTPSVGNNIGLAFVEKFDNSGTPGWGKSSILLNGDISLSKIAANSRGEVIAVGYLLQGGSTESKGYIVKIDTTTGEVQWDRSIECSYTDAATSVLCEDVTIDDEDNFYIVGRLFTVSETRAFVARYSPEGNLVWQKETPFGEHFEYYQVKIDNTTKQLITYGRYIDDTNQQYGILTKYESIGDQIWRRKMYVSNTTVFGKTGNGGAVNLDASTQWYYMLYVDEATPDKYTFGRVSSSGNGLGAFQYAEGTGETIYYEILNIDDRVGRLSDGSVRNDSSDLVSYPFNANKLMFDDLATPIANKKVQITEPNLFEYSGSPAIRPADFQELNLLGSVYSGSGDWLDQSGKGNNAVTSFTTSAEEPFSGAGSVEFDGTNDNLSISSTNIINTNSFTVECFARPQRSGLSANETFVEFNTGTRWIFGRKHSAGDVIYYWNGSDVFTTNSGTISANQWSHLAWSKDGTTLRMFVNGVLAHTQTGVTGSFTSSLITIGENSDGFEDYQGYISNLRVVQGTALYTSNFTPPTAALTNTGQTAGAPAYSDYGYGTFLRAAVNAFDGSTSTRAEPDDNKTIYFDFSHVNPTGTLLNFNGNSKLPTYLNQGGDTAGDGIRSNPIYHAFDGSTSTYCDMTYLNGQFSRLTFENPITNVTNITIGYDGEGDPGYNGGNNQTSTSFNGSRQTVQLYNGSAITLTDLDFISRPGSGVCRLYDVTITVGGTATTLTLDGGVSVSSSLRTYLDKAGSPGSNHFTVNTQQLGGSVPSGGWLTINGVSKLKQIALYHQSGSSSVELFAVEVDGSILVDGSGGTTGTMLLTAQGGSITDASDSNLSITVNGDAAAAVGGTNTVAYNAAGGYFDFDGTNDYIQLPTNSDLTFAGDFSYETWLWTDVQPASNHIWSLPNGQTFQFTTLNSQQELIYYSDQTSNQSFGPLANNTWAHYVITKSGNTITGYLNGAQAWTSTPGSSATHNFSAVSIGYRTFNSDNTFYWDGRMGEIRIYPRALTAGQVFQNYNASKETYTGVAASTDPGLTSTRTP